MDTEWSSLHSFVGLVKKLGADRSTVWADSSVPNFHLVFYTNWWEGVIEANQGQNKIRQLGLLGVWAVFYAVIHWNTLSRNSASQHRDFSSSSYSASNHIRGPGKFDGELSTIHQVQL